MSCYVVANAHIDAIVTFACTRDNVFTVRNMSADGHHRIANYTADAIGQALLDENYRSYNHRYRETGDAHRYTHRPFTRTLSAVAILKACDSYAYQSCEHPEWDTSWAKDFIDRVRLRAISQLPGYDDAEWEIRDHAAPVPRRMRA